MKQNKPYSFHYSVMAIVASIILYSCGNISQPETAAAPEVQAYPVFKLAAKDATLATDYPANLQGIQNIEIRPKIDGFIEAIYIDEGATVKKGQLLFRIRAPQYQQDLNTAAAAINSAEADLNVAELQVQKTRTLVEKDIISKFELQSAENNLKVRKSALAQAQANYANAKTNLGYTTITSPVNGMVGALPYKLGSLVGSTTPMPLTTISNISKVYAYFSMNEKQLLEFSKQYLGSTIEEKLNQLPPVDLILSDGTTYPEKGKVETISGFINSQTGTASFRASFPNPLALIRSGGSALVRMPVFLKNAVVIPQKSTYELQGKHFVYLVQDSGKVTSTEIGIMDKSVGQYYVVTGGLKPGETLVLESAAPLPDGTRIKPDLQPEDKVYGNLK
ncbi:efflux RND transporter periplasmic adaptor subunit [Flavihumibacter fluvii]|uniref:efflux RND transporter periplasmic adaptor subunit n=1 Tax=Flavihumibacter fluvii TaxID=2838157 RepID=UPI001BDE9485|nr:efflux RND transporter periplasmic adaptor subunit [Flavihumibacter fluvii]ULQ52008.1 efflux RND transporter periplasmic adaptor subunit [Flavihumibacter fluvii]